MATAILARRSPAEIVESIGSLFEKNRGTALSPTVIAQKTSLNYNSCREYLGIIRYAQNLPGLEEVRTLRGKAFMMPLSAYPEKERHRILREEFGVSFTEADRLYLGLLGKGATSPKRAARLEKTKVVRQGLKMQHLAEANGKFWLTEIGRMVAEGAGRIFSGNKRGVTP